MDKNLQDYSRCRVLLKRRERKAGLKPKVPGELVQDYFQPEFDNCPLVKEYRQLSKLFEKPDSGGMPDGEAPSQLERKRPDGLDETQR
jgi:hypothetical protein